MPNETVSRRYAVAVYQLATEANVVTDVRSDLHEILRNVRSDPSIESFFRSPVVDRKAKEQVFADSFRLVNPIAMHTLLLLIRKRREALFAQIVGEYDKLVAEANKLEPLTVTSAHELAKPELDALVERLSRLYNTKFTVEQRVDPSLIGGVRLMMGDRRIDGTVAGALDDLARSLSAN
jgi:F-type H+-transporting ATPase subunit delta